MISCRDWRPWKKPFYIAMTQKQSRNEWNGGIAARPVPKFPSAKIRWKGFRLDFLVSRRYLPHWLSSKGSNYQRGYYSPLLVQLKDILKDKCGGNVTNVFPFLQGNAPAQRTIATLKKLVYLCFQCLDYPPCSPGLDPSDSHLYPGWKKRLKSRYISFDVEVIVAAETWLDGQILNCFECLPRDRAMGDDVYLISSVLIWINPEFGRCNLFPSRLG